MRILIIPDYGDTGSGTFHFLKRLLELYKKRNIKTAVLIQENQQLPEALELFKKKDVQVFTGRVRKGIWGKPYFAFIFDYFFSRKAVKQFKPHVIHVSTGSFFYNLGAFIYRCSVIYTMHTYPVFKLRRGIRWWARMQSSRRKVFHTVSRFSADNIHKYFGVDNIWIKVIPNGVDDGIPEKDTEKKNIILTAGHIVWYKNPEVWLDTAVRVLKQRPDVTFIWIGEGEMGETIRTKIISLKLEKNIKLPGLQQDTAAFYRQAVIYFHPSKMESQGITIIEAMSFGLPCVASSAGGIPESIVDGETGYLHLPDDSAAFADSILKILGEPGLGTRMGTAGKNLVHERFSLSCQEQGLLNMYDEITARDNE